MILSLFLFNAVYAQDGADESLEIDSNQLSLQSAGNDFALIQALIDGACDGDAIELKGSTYFGNGTPISIDKSITINGNDAVLDGRDQSGIFRISEGSNVVLLNLTLMNAKEDGLGSAIRNHGVLTIGECNLNSNKADSGIIYNDNVINVHDSTFSSNSADFGGVVYNDGSLSIDNSKFTSNKASDAAAICSFSDLTVSNCEFQKNTISHSYGVIYVGYGSASISDSLFKGNKGSDEGCCIFTGKQTNVEIKNSRFMQNAAYSYAGAIDNGGDMLVDNCSFDKNSAWGAGAIDNGGTLTVLNSNFTQNSAIKNGGAIDTVGIMQAINCIFQSNSAGNEGGAMIFRGDANVSESSFIDNRAGIADAIYINDVNYSIDGNWWGSDNPDFSRLLNVNLTDDFTWIEHESEMDDANTTVTNNTENRTDIPINAHNQTDETVDNADSKTDYDNPKNPVSEEGEILRAMRAVETYGYGNHAKVNAADDNVPQIRHAWNLNVNADVKSISKVSKDIRLTLKNIGRNFAILTYSNGILSFNLDNATFWSFKIPQSDLIDKLIAKFNLAPLDIILMF